MSVGSNETSDFWVSNVRVYSWISGIGTTISPRDNTDLDTGLVDQWTTRVTLKQIIFNLIVPIDLMKVKMLTWQESLPPWA